MPMNNRLLVPRATGFNPRSIAGLALWLDAADASTITVSTGVSQWADKSTSGSLWTQGTGNNQPATGTQTMNGRNVLVFDGSNDSLSATAPIALADLPKTVFVVQRIAATVNFGTSQVANVAAGGFRIRQNSTTGRVQINNTSTNELTTFSTTSLNVNEIVSCTLTSPTSGSTAYRSGAIQANTGANDSLATFGANAWALGFNGGGSFFNGWLAEVLIYNAALSASQLSAVHRYLGSKWGITVA
jgi:hypothetical protein